MACQLGTLALLAEDPEMTPPVREYWEMRPS